MKIYLDGKFVEERDAKVSVFDHGLLYGDGVFEGIRAYNGRVFKLKEHVKRLFNSARAIMLSIPATGEEVEKIVLKTLRVNKLKNGYVRLVVTRGIGDLGLDPLKCKVPTIFCIADKIQLYPPGYYQKGLEIVIVSTRRVMPEALNPCIKSLNYLNNILAKIEANRAGVPEAIMLNSEGYVAECTGDNIFIIKGRTLLTPPTWAGALDGITRQTVMELAQKKLRLDVREDLMTPYHLYVADECFLTGTAAEAIPVTRVDTRIIGDGNPGRITLKLMKEFHRLTETTGVAI